MAFAAKKLRPQEEQNIGTQPVIFDIAYTPYRLKKNAAADERAKHEKERAFYDMSGADNIYKYIIIRALLGFTPRPYSFEYYVLSPS